MPQLAPIMWTTLFIFLWSTLIVWSVFEWSKSMKSFKTLTFSNKVSKGSGNIWSW